MKKEFLGYSFLNNVIKEIYKEDYPDYNIIRGDKYGVSLINEDIGDSFFAYNNKIDLIDHKIESLEDLIKTNEQTINILKWKNIANNLSLDYFRKQLEH